MIYSEGVQDMSVLEFWVCFTKMLFEKVKMEPVALILATSGIMLTVIGIRGVAKVLKKMK